MTEISHIKSHYDQCSKKIDQARKALNKPLTLAQKILACHMKNIEDENGQPIVPGVSNCYYYPDRVAMQDATAQMAILQFVSANKKKVALPTTIHCDHLIQAEVSAKDDIRRALKENKEVYDFLRSASAKYGIGFWQPNSGIIHQVALEVYAFPGGMMIGTDSHTPNAGGLGMIAIGVGGADAVDVMVGGPLQLKWPKGIGVRLTGKLSGWAAPKDVILKLMGILTVKGGTGHIVEFFGDGCKNISCTGKATITNMGAEHGATTSVFPFDKTMSDYLRASNRADIADLAEQNQEFLRADDEVLANPGKYFDRLIEIDLSKLSPSIVGPHSPDKTHSLPELKEAIAKEHFPNHISAALVGSCTNSSYEDIARAASIAKVAHKHGLKARVPFYITPGSHSVYLTTRKHGHLTDLESIGGEILANACGPCIGQWKRTDIKMGDVNTIVSSYNRNFPGRNDQNAATLSFLTSPEVVVGMALNGNLDFNPLTDSLKNDQGDFIKLPIPEGETLPKEGLTISWEGYVAPPENGESIQIEVDEHSNRIALLEPFPKWSGKDFMGLPVLLKAKGKCTTDHISMAGPWLKFRGHLDKIADNTYLGAQNAFTKETGTGIFEQGGQEEIKPLPKIARLYKAEKQGWVVIGDENFGEGSSREHAAMQPRYLGCLAIIVRSFARIHETNLKKQGILPLTFSDVQDYDRIKKNDRLDIRELASLKPNKPVDVVIHHNDGSIEKIKCLHSLSDTQIEWFKAGSALNYLAATAGK